MKLADTDLTLEKLLEAYRASLAMAPFNGIRVVQTVAAMADSDERAFPASRHRSKRIHKKLVKRHGGEFVKVPAMYGAGNTIYAHPARYAELRQLIPAIG